ncbi:bola protein [Ampelomyces quisqualis]|uniref:Bola protein n=1 Tax=Ampelomyces quisqualis TaxID=50730 RepID=A0A6A5QF37_AMPQU|nr:bola protein [Ampelomyces quisqualis]
MFRRSVAVAGKRHLSAMSHSMTPMEDALRTKITDALKPTTLQIFNDSHKHSHHQAMQGVTSKETHFRLVITSSSFEGKMQLARHRMVNTLMKDELAREGGIHALQLTTRTPQEEESKRQKEAAGA